MPYDATPQTTTDRADFIPGTTAYPVRVQSLDGGRDVVLRRDRAGVLTEIPGSAFSAAVDAGALTVTLVDLSHWAANDRLVVSRSSAAQDTAAHTGATATSFARLFAIVRELIGADVGAAPAVDEVQLRRVVDAALAVQDPKWTQALQARLEATMSRAQVEGAIDAALDGLPAAVQANVGGAFVVGLLDAYLTSTDWRTQPEVAVTVDPGQMAGDGKPTAPISILADGITVGLIAANAVETRNVLDEAITLDKLAAALQSNWRNMLLSAPRDRGRGRDRHRDPRGRHDLHLRRGPGRQRQAGAAGPGPRSWSCACRRRPPRRSPGPPTPGRAGRSWCTRGGSPPKRPGSSASRGRWPETSPATPPPAGNGSGSSPASCESAAASETDLGHSIPYVRNLGSGVTPLTEDVSQLLEAPVSVDDPAGMVGDEYHLDVRVFCQGQAATLAFKESTDAEPAGTSLSVKTYGAGARAPPPPSSRVYDEDSRGLPRSRGRFGAVYLRDTTATPTQDGERVDVAIRFPPQRQADWSQETDTDPTFIKNKPAAVVQSLTTRPDDLPTDQAYLYTGAPDSLGGPGLYVARPNTDLPLNLVTGQFADNAVYRANGAVQALPRSPSNRWMLSWGMRPDRAGRSLSVWLDQDAPAAETLYAQVRTENASGVWSSWSPVIRMDEGTGFSSRLTAPADARLYNGIRRQPCPTTTRAASGGARRSACGRTGWRPPPTTSSTRAWRAR